MFLQKREDGFFGGGAIIPQYAVEVLGCELCAAGGFEKFPEYFWVFDRKHGAYGDSGGYTGFFQGFYCFEAGCDGGGFGFELFSDVFTVCCDGDIDGFGLELL